MWTNHNRIPEIKIDRMPDKPAGHLYLPMILRFSTEKEIQIMPMRLLADRATLFFFFFFFFLLLSSFLFFLKPGKYEYIENPLPP